MKREDKLPRWLLRSSSNALLPSVGFHRDSIPRAIPVGGNSSYAFVSTGIHVFGNSAMYGQDFHVCVGNPWDPECMGGNNEADHCE